MPWCLTIAHHRDRAFLGERFVVPSGKTQLGRGAACFDAARVFEDDRISREHAELDNEGDVLTLRDHQSRNGTSVNGSPITTHVLTSGDVISLGKMLLVVGRGPETLPALEVGDLVGASPAHAALCEQIASVAAQDTTVVFVGPSGVGKTAFARALHEASGREGTMVELSCGAVDESALHSELFGHEKGAFAGATRARRGLVEAAQGGTLLLDGIADAPDALQVALRDFVTTRKLRRLGGSEDIDVDVRLMATAGESLDDSELAVALGGLEIRVPPLEERPEDLGILADFFVRRYGGPDARLHMDFALHVQRRTFPGQVRELEALVELGVIDSDGAELIETPSRIAADKSSDEGNRYVIAANGAWFRTPHGERVELSDRKNLMRMLAAFAGALGSRLTVPELLAAGWPGERVQAKSGANRVYVALTTLRRLGLRDVLERQREGYAIASDARVDVQ